VKEVLAQVSSASSQQKIGNKCHKKELLRQLIIYIYIYVKTTASM